MPLLPSKLAGDPDRSELRDERFGEYQMRPRESIHGATCCRSGWARLPAAYRDSPAGARRWPRRALTVRGWRGDTTRIFRSRRWFLPKRLHQHFFNVYAYCRISDDLGDEVGDTQVSLALLDRWEEELRAMYRRLDAMAGAGGEGGPTHPVFVALAETVREFGIPQHEFSDLLTAFRQDQTVSRYESFDDLLGYCRNSANPVGHLVLYLCGYADAGAPAAFRLHLHGTATGELLAGRRGATSGKGRIYIPLEDLRRFGVTEQVIAEGNATAGVPGADAL